ncbi:MAG TPA: hypothetical protein VK631_23295 [Solirubrobacteraceae bacterium]|nr:hypothetical protein [Solirubrobacteraceae bacterium]
MESGRVLLSGTADSVLNNPEMAALDFGGSVTERARGSASGSIPDRATAPAGG